MFKAPIPGESLTGAPKNFNWERPPEVTDPKEAIDMHLSRLNDPDRLEAIMNALDIGSIDIYNLTKGLMRSAVAEGIHSIDVALIAAPVVHEFIKQAANKMGVDYEEGLEDKESKEEYQKSMVSARANKMANVTPEKEEVVFEEPAPKGLMSRETN